MKNKCVYIKNTEKEYAIVCLYIDDILITGSSNKLIKAIKKMLTSKFDMKDVRVVDIILWIKITRTNGRLILSQLTMFRKF